MEIKKFSLVSLVVVLVVAFFCGKASAGNFEVIENAEVIITSVDKDSIKRGTASKNFQNLTGKTISVRL